MNADDVLFGGGFRITVPMPFPGTAADIGDNIASHTFTDGYCDRCGSKPRHVAAAWPCGDDPDVAGFDRLPGRIIR